MDLCGGQEISEKPSLLLAPQKGHGLCSHGLREPLGPTEHSQLTRDLKNLGGTGQLDRGKRVLMADVSGDKMRFSS